MLQIVWIDMVPPCQKVKIVSEDVQGKYGSVSVVLPCRKAKIVFKASMYGSVMSVISPCREAKIVSEDVLHIVQC